MKKSSVQPLWVAALRLLRRPADLILVAVVPQQGWVRVCQAHVDEEVVLWIDVPIRRPIWFHVSELRVQDQMLPRCQLQAPRRPIAPRSELQVTTTQLMAAAKAQLLPIAARRENICNILVATGKQFLPSAASNRTRGFSWQLALT